MKAQEIEGLDEVLRDMLNKLFPHGKSTTLPNFKIAVAQVEYTKKGWVTVNYKDLQGKPVSFSKKPYLSVVTTGVHGEMQPPKVSLPRVKVKLQGANEVKVKIHIPRFNKFQPPAIGVPSVPRIPTISNVPRIPHVHASRYNPPKVPHVSRITAPRIANRYCFKYNGNQYCYSNRKDYFYHYTEIVFANNLRNRLGSWSLSFTIPVINKKLSVGLNWLRDAIVNGFTYVEKYLTSAIGYMIDIATGDEVRSMVQVALDDVVGEINGTVVDKTNSYLSSTASAITNNVNSALSTSTNNINSAIDKINNRLQSIVNSINKDVGAINSSLTNFRNNVEATMQATLNALVDEFNQKIADAWNKQAESIQHSFLDLITQINEITNETAKGIENSVNVSLEQIENGITQSINSTITELWTLLGLEKGIVFQPAIVGDVGTKSVQIWSTGKGKAYVIAIGE